MVLGGRCVQYNLLVTEKLPDGNGTSGKRETADLGEFAPIQY
jgi:hypothetical protein